MPDPPVFSLPLKRPFGSKAILRDLESEPDPVNDGKNGTQERDVFSDPSRKILPRNNPRRKIRVAECQIYGCCMVVWWVAVCFPLSDFYSPSGGASIRVNNMV